MNRRDDHAPHAPPLRQRPHPCLTGREQLPRSFRMPWIAVLAPLGVAFSLLLIFGLPWPDANGWQRIGGLPAITFERFVIWMALGCLIYFGYGMRHSRLERDG